MTYTIFNRGQASVHEMFFDSVAKLDKWLEANPNFENLGVTEYTLPTRHVRVNVEFAGCGS